MSWMMPMVQQMQQQQQQAQQQQPAQQTTMPVGEQQIYNFLSPQGAYAEQTYGQQNPLQQNLSTQYTGQQTANPIQPSYLGTPAQGQATTFNGAQLGQGVNQSLLNQFSPQAAQQALYSAFMPAQATATANLNNSLAAMGLQGGPAIQAQQQLQQQLTSGLGQSLAGLIQNAQGNQMNLYNTQADLNQRTGLANQSAMNQMTGQNLSNLYNANQYNATANNDANSAYTQALLNAYNQNANNFQAMNQAGYSGATDLAGSQMTGQQSLAGQMVNNFPTYGGVSSAFSNLGSSMGQGGKSSGGGYNAAGTQSNIGFQPSAFTG